MVREARALDAGTRAQSSSAAIVAGLARGALRSRGQSCDLTAAREQEPQGRVLSESGDDGASEEVSNADTGDREVERLHS